MARACTICTHEHRTDIDRALVAGEPYRSIAARFDAGESAVNRHRGHIKALLAKAERKATKVEERHTEALTEQIEAIESTEAEAALSVRTEVRLLIVKTTKMLDACDVWLRDPDDPEKYDIGARADDINVVVWEDGPNGQPVQKKRKMSYLLEKLEKGGVVVERWETKHADPRDLFLKTLESIKGQLDMIAKLTGEYAPVKGTLSFDLKKEAERLAGEFGVSVDEVYRDSGIRLVA